MHRIPGQVAAVVLGAAQDAGVPQAGCACATCSETRLGKLPHRLPACLGLVDRGSASAWLIDATPAFPEQLQRLNLAALECNLRGILLTHAHIGHYTGLMYLGREAMNTRGLPVYASRRMGDFLRANAPWRLLVQLGNIRLIDLEDQRPVVLSPGLTIIPRAVVHRGEFSDTLAFQIGGPGRNLLYCPDIDRWENLPGGGLGWLDGIDVALLDGTFFSADELKGRSMREVPHPLAQTTAETFRDAAVRKYLVHLNHTNPLWRKGSERAWLEEQGLGVAEEGQAWQLD